MSDGTVVWNPNGNTHFPGPTTAENFHALGGTTAVFDFHTPPAGYKASINLQAGVGPNQVGGCFHKMTIDGHEWPISQTPNAWILTGDSVVGRFGAFTYVRRQGLKPDTDYTITIETDGIDGADYYYHLNVQPANWA